MKSKKIIWGMILIALAIVMILDVFHVFTPLTDKIGEISLWVLLCGIALLILIINRLCKGKISHIFFPLAFIFMLFEKNIALLCGAEKENIINNWLLLLIALLFTAGFSLLFPSRSKKYHIKGHHAVGQHSISSATYSDHAENSLGHSVIYIDSETFSPNHVENNLGSCKVFFENPGAYTGNGTLYIENNLGSLTIYTPKGWYVKESMENNLGGVHIPQKDDGLLLRIKGENNLGSVTVVYV